MWVNLIQSIESLNRTKTDLLLSCEKEFLQEMALNLNCNIDSSLGL